MPRLGSERSPSVTDLIQACVTQGAQEPPSTSIFVQASLMSITSAVAALRSEPSLAALSTELDRALEESQSFVATSARNADSILDRSSASKNPEANTSKTSTLEAELSVSEAVSIHMYCSDSELAHSIRKTVHKGDSALCGPFLRLLNDSLEKLNPVATTLFWNVESHLESVFVEGARYLWEVPMITTLHLNTDISSAISKSPLSQSGGTVVVVNASHAYDVSRFVGCQSDMTCVLLPALTHVQVQSVHTVQNNMQIVQLQCSATPQRRSEGLFSPRNSVSGKRTSMCGPSLCLKPPLSPLVTSPACKRSRTRSPASVHSAHSRASTAVRSRPTSPSAFITTGMEDEDEIGMAIADMSIHLIDLNIQQTCAQILLDFSETDDGRKTIAHSGGLDALLAAMQQHENDEEMQRIGATIIMNLSQSNECDNALARSAALNVILSAMKKFVTNVEILVSNMISLANIADDAAVRTRLVRLGAVRIVTKVLRENLSSETITQYACGCLFVLSQHFDHDAFLEEITADAIIKAIRTYPDSELVLRPSLLILQSLTAGAACTTQIIKCDGLRVIVDVVCDPDSECNADVQLSAASILANVSGFEDGRRFLAKAGAVPAFIELMRGILLARDEMLVSMAKDILQACCWALMNIASDPAAQVLCLLAGAVDVLADVAKSTYAADHGHLLCGALGNLASTKAGAKSVVRASGLNAVLSIMTLSQEHTDTQMYACAALRNVIKNSDEAASLIVSANGIEITTRTMHKHLHVTNIQLYSLEFLLELIITDSGATDLTTDFMASTVIAVMKAHPFDSMLHYLSCNILQHLSESPSQLPRIIKADGVEVLLRDAETFADEIDIQITLCCILMHLTESQLSWSRVHAQQGIPRILHHMVVLKYSEHYQQYACGFLGNLACDTDMCVDIGCKGGVEQILSAIQEHPLDEGIQIRGCGALMLLSEHERNQQLIEQLGGIGTIIAALTAHYQIQDVACFATLSLASLASSNEEYGVLIAKSGAVDAILSSMKHHLSDVKIHESSCRALRAIARSHCGCDCIISTGALNPLVDSMKRFGSDERIQHMAIWTFMTIAENRQYLTALMKCCASQAVLFAMQRFHLSAEIQRCGCGVMCKLAVEQANKSLLARIGVISAMVTAITTHPQCEIVQVYALSCLMFLLDDVSTHLWIGNAPLLERVIEAMKSHFGSPDVQVYGCGIFMALGESDVQRDRLIASEAVYSIVEAMNVFNAVDDVQQYGAWALGNIAKDDLGREFVADTGAIDALLLAMKHHSRSEDIVTRCAWSLGKIMCIEGVISRHRRLPDVFSVVMRGSKSFPTNKELNDIAERMQQHLSCTRSVSANATDKPSPMRSRPVPG